jgi:hypothetical protein
MSFWQKTRPVRDACHIGLPRVGRRELLTAGAGAALLPFLPVLNSRAQQSGPPKRFLFCFQDNGTIASEWKPTGTETDFTFKRILAPLEAHKQDLLLLSGLDLEPEPGPPHSGHPQLLSNVSPDLGMFRLSPGITLDQFLARERNDMTRFGTLELGVVPFGGDDFYTHEILYRGIGPPAQLDTRAAAGGEHLALDARPRRALRRAELEAPTSADHVERERVPQPASAVSLAHVFDEPAGTEMVRLAGVGPLLGARCGEPYVAMRIDDAHPPRESDEDAHPGRVVVRAGPLRDAVGVRHHDLQAAARAVELADDVARPAGAAVRNGEASETRLESGALEPPLDVTMRAQLGAACRGPRADVTRQVDGGVVGVELASRRLGHEAHRDYRHRDRQPLHAARR